MLFVFKFKFLISTYTKDWVYIMGKGGGRGLVLTVGRVVETAGVLWCGDVVVWARFWGVLS